jgi:hypothetical protein
MMRWWGAHFLIAEGTVATAVAAAFGLWVRFGNQAALVDVFLKGNRTALYGALASVFGALLGFVITTLTIVLGFSQHPRLARVRNSRHYGTLWKVFSASIRAMAFATAAPMVALLLDRDESPMYFVGLVVFWSGLLGVARLARCIWVLENIVEIVTKPEEPIARVASADEDEEDVA